jgi:hypothetical protein
MKGSLNVSPMNIFSPVKLDQKQPSQDVEVIGVNDRGQLEEHVLVSGMIPVRLWSSQFHK